ncbi:MAG: enterochelin esterase-like enzyme [Rhodothermales bacterium]|nr:enterochelin esterase-like enzyme [Rhodothermales bacterium]
MRSPALLTFCLLLAACSTAPEREGPTFTVEFTQAAADSIQALGLDVPVEARLFVVLSRSDEREPRLQTGVNGVPFWGKMVSGLEPGDTVEFSPGDPDVVGFPLESLADLPEGSYHVQPLLSVYTRFDRADGHSISMHLNSGAGQNQWRAPGNAIGSPTSFTYQGGSARHALSLDRVIPPTDPVPDGGTLQQGNPPNTDWVKFVKIRSRMLSDFWGRDMYIGANVLLPAGYGQSARSYPTIYMQGHFPGGRAPFGFSEEGGGQGRGDGFSEYWMSGDAPPVVAVSFRDANPYYDTAYSVNSENVGPYGDAITEELIPYLEQEFRLVPEEWARVVAGGSTGGWEAIAMQVFYPDYFGGSWGWCPDPVDFNYHQIVNVYDDDNAYFTTNEWHSIERPNARRFDGNVRSTVRQENLLEHATGPNTRSGGQWAIWEAVFSPVGDDGYPRPIWDPLSGAIDHETADFWKSNYDIHQYLRANWETVGPQLDGKLHIAVGDMDSYYLDNAVYLLDEFLSNATGPRIDARFEYGRRKPHCWIGYSPSGSGEDLTWREFLDEAAAHMYARAGT